MAIKKFSNQDGNLSTSISTSRDKLYSDIDALMAMRPSGDIYKKVDAAAVRQAVKNLLLTNKGEKPFAYHYGGNLRALFFDQADFFTEKRIEEQVIFTIKNHEPRAKLVSVKAKSMPEYNDVSVKIVFQVVNTPEVVTLETSLARLR